VGRWVSEDPLGFVAGDGNVSRYVRNAVSGLTDPAGLVAPFRDMDWLFPKPAAQSVGDANGIGRGRQLYPPADQEAEIGGQREEGGMFDGFPRLKIPPRIQPIRIESGSADDTMATTIAGFGLGLANKNGKDQLLVFPPESMISKRIWDSEHNSLMSALREWFEKGADSYNYSEEYKSGITTVKYNVPSKDIWRDIFKRYSHGNDIHIFCHRTGRDL